MKVCPGETDIRLSRTSFECDTTIQFTFGADSATSSRLPVISIVDAATSTVINTWNTDGTTVLAAGSTTQSTKLVWTAQNEAVFESDDTMNLATIKAELCQGAKCDMLDIFPSAGLL